jgi:hypothetical protein
MSEIKPVLPKPEPVKFEIIYDPSTGQTTVTTIAINDPRFCAYVLGQALTAIANYKPPEQQKILVPSKKGLELVQ